ncbi:MAG TPA: MqnA/MqnD/SBP family protein [bacterium]|nr:MqnA/MqnD/SBP family protein [bacterium]
MTTIRLAHSPDADDAFMFYGLAKGKIDTEGLTYEHILKDIQTLNEWAREGRMEVTAISAHAYAYVKDKYAVLTHGGSIGKNYGPQVVAKSALPLESLRGKKIAVPGKLTSAYLALKIRFPDFEEVVVPFDEIMDEVVKGTVDAGLLIHEGQLTHAQKGLVKILDLGEWWYQEKKLPLPMGLNAIRRDLPEDVKRKASKHLKQSIRYSLEHRAEALDYDLGFGRGLSRDVADQFVGMWVNERTVDMGEEGRTAIREFLKLGEERRIIPPVGAVEFVD